MAVLSPEAQKNSLDSRISAFVAAGTIAVGILFTQAEGLPQDTRDKVRIRETSPNPVPDITTASRASLQKYEKIFDCDIQTDTKPDPDAERRASSKEKKCAQYIAGVIGENTYDWGPGQHKALIELWTNESQWSANADNPISTAYGIPQALLSKHGPGIKREFGNGAAAFNENTVSQIQWGIDYIHERYGSPIAANKAWHSRCDGQYGCWY